VSGSRRADGRPLLALLLVCAALVLFSNLANPMGLHQNDEDHYLGVSRIMYDSGDYVVPVWDNRPTFMKPPLLYWMMCLSMRLLGPTVLAGRLPVALLALLTVLATSGLARRLLPERDVSQPVLAGLMTVTTVGFLQYGRVAMMDIPLTLCMVCGSWATLAMGRGSASAVYGLAVAIAASVLLKGPAAGLVLGIGVVAWLTVGRRGDALARALPRLHLVGGLGLLVVLIAAWPLALQQRGLLEPFYRQFIVGENFGKFEGARNPIGGMLAGFLTLALPWTFVLLAAALAWTRSSRRFEPYAVLPLCFFAANLLVYALPAIKWAQYLLPALPLLLIFTIGIALAPDGDARGPLSVGRAVRVGAVLSGCFLIAIAPVVALGGRLFPSWEIRLPIFGLAVALACTGLCMAVGTRLLSAAASFAVGLACVSFLAPALTLERLPPEVGSLAQGRALMSYGVPPYGYQTMLGRSVGVCSVPEDFRANFSKGVMFIVGDTEMRSLMAAHALDPERARMLICWKKWRRRMTAGRVVDAIFRARLDDLTENVCLIDFVSRPGQRQ
jgi:4-amino-4-deoxy-L-arabinose transferase-like glycosyltransferase